MDGIRKDGNQRWSSWVFFTEATAEHLIALLDEEQGGANRPGLRGKLNRFVKTNRNKSFFPEGHRDGAPERRWTVIG